MEESILGIDIGIRNFSICQLVCSDAGITMPLWENLDFFSLLECEKVSLNQLKIMELFDLCQLSIDHMNKLFDEFRNVRHVVIEAQPNGKYQNPKIQMVQFLIYSYFRTKLTKPTPATRLRSVQFIPASHKYIKKYMTGPEIRDKRDYAQRKAFSISLAWRIITQWAVTGEIGRINELGGKKDDLADSFLLAASFLSGLLPPDADEEEEKKKTRKRRQPETKEKKEKKGKKQKTLAQEEGYGTGTVLLLTGGGVTTGLTEPELPAAGAGGGGREINSSVT